MKQLTTKFWFGDNVFLKHCPEQLPRMVVDIHFEGGPERIAYVLACGSEKTLHYEAEICFEQDKLRTMNLELRFEP